MLTKLLIERRNARLLENWCCTRMKLMVSLPVRKYQLKVEKNEKKLVTIALKASLERSFLG